MHFPGLLDGSDYFGYVDCCTPLPWELAEPPTRESLRWEIDLLSQELKDCICYPELFEDAEGKAVLLRVWLRGLGDCMQYVD